MAGKGILQIKVMGDSSHLEASLKKVVGAVAGLAVFKQVADYMVDAGKAAAEEDQQMQQLSKALQDNAGVTKEQYGEVEKWIAATQRASATADGELRPALLKLSSTTKDVGQAQDILTTALDISKARGLDLNTVVIALEKGYQGNVGGLQRLGIATKDAEGNTLSFADVMKNANETYGGAAQEAANTTAGRMENLSLTLADLKETVGMALLPVIEKFTGFIMDNMPTIEKVMVGFAELVGLALNILSDTVFPILQKVFESFTQSVSDKTPGTNTIFEGIGKVVDALLLVFEKVWPLIWGTVDTFIGFLTGPTGQAIINSLMTAIGTVLEGVGKVFEKVWPVIQKVVQTFIDFFDSPAGQKLISSLLGLVSTAVDLVLAAFNACWPILESVVGIFLSFFDGSGGASFIVDLVQTVIDIVNDVLSVFTSVFEAIGPIIGPLIDGICKMIQGVITIVTDLINKLLRLIGLTPEAETSAQRAALAAGGSKVSGMGNTVAVLTSAYNAAQNKTGGSKNIPQYALGGPVDDTGLALVHRGEHVLNRSDMSELGKVLAGGLRGGGGITVNIYGMSHDTAETLSGRVLFDLARVGAI